MFSFTTFLVLIEMICTFSNALLPSLSSSSSHNVVAVLGGDLLLHCLEEHLGQLDQIEGIQILTVGS